MGVQIVLRIANVLIGLSNAIEKLMEDGQLYATHDEFVGTPFDSL